MYRFRYRVLFILTLSFIFKSSIAQKWIPIDYLSEGKPLTTEIINSDQSGYQVKVVIHGLYDELIKRGGDTFHFLSFGCANYSSDVGKPLLPLFTQSIAIPEGAKVSASVLNEKWEDIEIGKIFPKQNSLFGTEYISGFELDKNAYQNSYIPQKLNVSPEMLWRNIRNININICPFRYFPLESRISVMREFTLNVIFDYSKEHIATDNELEDLLNLFDNLPYTVSKRNRQQNVSESVRNVNTNAYNYLIIVGSGTGLFNSDKLKEFQRWKAMKGYKTYAVSTSTTGSTSSQIKEYISREYENGVRYVLFVGDYDEVPLASVYTARNRYVDSDYWYGCIDGDEDLQADLAIGRFSVESEADLVHLVDKTIRYESTYSSSNNVLLVAHAEGADQNFQGCCEQIYNAHQQNMSFIKAYGSGIYGNNATNSFVVEKINQGAHIVNYRGHGAPTFWGGELGVPSTVWNDTGESFTIDEIDSLDERTCAVFFSVACQTGNIAGQTCMLEKFTRSSHGAVAYIGATEDTNNDVNHNYDKLLFNKLLNAGVSHIGDLNVSAHISNNITLNSAYKDNPFCYLCGGDPTLEIWTAVPSLIDADVNFSNGSAVVTTNLTGDYYISVVSIDGERLDSISCTSSNCAIPVTNSKFFIVINKHNYFPRIIYIDTESTSIVNMRFNYDAYYTATPLSIFTEPAQTDDEEGTIVKSGNKLVIKKGSQGVNIQEDFNCEEGAVFEIK